jgi:hypothetical protein
LYTAHALDIHENQDLFIRGYRFSAGKAAPGDKQGQQHIYRYQQVTGYSPELFAFQRIWRLVCHKDFKYNLLAYC